MKLSLVLGILMCLSAFATQKIVYGEDNRLEWYESNNAMFREIALSTAAMVPNENIKISGDKYTFVNVKTLEDAYQTCNKTRFAKQITAASCSGFLVGEDLLVTAGHCIEDKKDCKEYTWVFDYKLSAEGDIAKSGSTKDVYKCKEIVERKLSLLWGNDYAVIRLDRKTDRRPLEYNKGKKAQTGTDLVVIGHPSGLPQKIADGAEIKKTKRNYFMANLDAFGGNSGSAVFNARTGVVEGILVRGALDYVTRTTGCNEVNRVDNSRGGESVTYIQNIKVLGGGSPWWQW